MIIILRSKANDDALKKIAEDLEGYIKVVVDVHRKICSAGGKMHADGEKVMLQDGSKQEDLWGGGLDLETGSIDFDSMINIRPRQGNTSREVLDQKIRSQMEEVIRNLIR